MAQKGDLGLNTARRRKPAKGLCAKDAVARDQDGDRIGPARLTHSLRRCADDSGNLTIGPGFAEGYGRHRTADLALQALPPVQRQVKGVAVPGKIPSQLPQPFSLQLGSRFGAMPVQGHDLPISLGQADRPQRGKQCARKKARRFSRHVSRHGALLLCREKRDRVDFAVIAGVHFKGQQIGRFMPQNPGPGFRRIADPAILVEV
jgi:hypothetical protein